MSRVVAYARYLALAGVFFGLIATLAAFAWGGVKTVLLLGKLANGQFDGMAVGLVQVMDAFLIAAALLIFAFGVYQLFVGELGLPAALVIKDLEALKSKLAGVIVILLATTFLERLENLENGRGLIEAGVSVAAVSAVLVWMMKKT
ncbi:MAG TPA: YqhA family protein [Polyangia bacterium]